MTDCPIRAPWVWRLVWAWLCIPTVAFAAEPVQISSETEVVELSRHLEYLEDPEGNRSIGDILALADGSSFTSSGGGTLNFGLGMTSALWFRFSLEHQGRQSARVFLELANPYFDDVRVYTIRSNGDVSSLLTGLDEPISNRPVPHRNFVFPIEVDALETVDIVFRIMTEGSFRVPVKLWYGDTFWETDGDEIAFQGFFYGLLIVMALYNLFVFLSLRETAYLWYALFVASTGLSAACLTGIAAQYLVDHQPSLLKSLFLVSLGIGTWSGHRFVIDFLGLRQHSASFYKISSYFANLGVICVFLSFVLAYPSVLRISLAVMILGTPSVLLASIIRMQQGSIEARFYFASGICLALAVCTGGLTSFGVLPVNQLTVYAVQIGLAIQVVLLSLGLAER